MAGSNFIAFRVDDELAEAINQAVAASGMSKTDWLTEAIMIRLGTDSPEARLANLIEQLETVANKIASSDQRNTHSEPSGEVFQPNTNETITKPKKSRQKRTGELTEAQLAIIELKPDFEAQGASRIDFLIADELKARGLLTATGTNWDNRRVMNAKGRLKQKGAL